MIVIGVLLLLGAGVVAISALTGNSGDAHQLPGGIAVLGYQLNMSEGRLFGYGLALGAAAMLGLFLLFLGSARMSRSRTRTRRALADARRTSAAPAPVAATERRRTWPGQPAVTADSSTDEPTLVQETSSRKGRFGRTQQPVVVEESRPEPAAVVEETKPRKGRFGRAQQPVVVEQDRPEQVPVVVGSASRTMNDDTLGGSSRSSD